MKKIVVLLVLLFPAFAVSSITAQDAGTRPVITRENAGQVELLHVIGRGRIYDVDWSSDGEHIAVFSSDTVTVHDANNMSEKQVLQMEPCSYGASWCQGTVDFSEDSQTLLVGSGNKLTTYDENFSTLAVYEDDLDKSIILYNQPHEVLVYGGPAYTVTTVSPGFDPAIASPEVIPLFPTVPYPNFSEGVPVNVALSPDGHYLAIAHGQLMTSWLDFRSSFTETMIYDLPAIYALINEDPNTARTHNYFYEDKSLQISLEGDSGGLTHVTFSPDGTLLAGAGQNGQVRVWSMPDGAEVAVFDAHYTAAWDVAFSPDGTQLVSAGGDGTLRFRNVATGEETRVISGLKTAISSISYNPDGSQLVAGGWDGSLWIFDTATGDIIDELIPYSLPAWTIAFSPDGSQFAIGIDGNDVVLFDVIDQPPFIVEKYTFRKHAGPVYALASHPNEPRLASGGSDGAIYEWDTNTGELVAEVARPDSNTIFGLAYNPIDGSLHREAFRGARNYMGVPGPPVYDIEFSPDGSLMASGDVTIGQPGRPPMITLSPQRGVSDYYTSRRTKLTFSTDGSVLLSAGTRQDAYIWRMDDLAHETHIRQNGLLALSPDGSLVAGGSLDIYDAVSGQELVSNRHGPPYDAVFSPDGTLIVTSDTHALRIWGIKSN